MKIKVLMVRPMQEPVVEEIDSGLDGMQKAIGGGYIEHLSLGQGVGIICDEEGKLKGLPMNRRLSMSEGGDVLMGDFFVVRFKNAAAVSLTETDILQWMNVFSLKSGRTVA